MEKAMMDAIKTGMLSFALPEDKVLDYTEELKAEAQRIGAELEETHTP